MIYKPGTRSKYLTPSLKKIITPIVHKFVTRTQGSNQLLQIATTTNTTTPVQHRKVHNQLDISGAIVICYTGISLRIRQARPGNTRLDGVREPSSTLQHPTVILTHPVLPLHSYFTYATHTSSRTGAKKSYASKISKNNTTYLPIYSTSSNNTGLE